MPFYFHQPALFHVRTNVAPWGPDVDLQRVDECLEALGSTAIDVPLGFFPLESDGDHFTRRGQREFSSSLARGIAGRLAALATAG